MTITARSQAEQSAPEIQEQPPAQDRLRRSLKPRHLTMIAMVLPEATNRPVPMAPPIAIMVR